MKIIVLLFSFLFAFNNDVICQDSHVNFVDEKEFTDKKFDKRQTQYLFANRKSAIIKYNPLSLGLGGLLLFYQKFISAQLGANCPYEISCSEFSRLSIQEYGFFKGVPLTADRLTRCTEFAKIDITPMWFNSSGKIVDPISRHRLHEKHENHENHEH